MELCLLEANNRSWCVGRSLCCMWMSGNPTASNTLHPVPLNTRIIHAVQPVLQACSLGALQEIRLTSV